MTRTRFVVTLGALLAVFIGVGYAINHWQDGKRITLQAGDPAPLPSSASPSEATANTVESAAGDTAGEAAPVTETRMRKEFDKAAADAAAEADAAKGTVDAAGTKATRSVASPSVLVTASLDAVTLSATGTSVIAGRAPAGTTVTLLANDQELASVLSDESGAWTMILDQPVAPGTYRLKLKAVGPGGGDAVVREVGEATVKAPETVAAVESAAAGDGSGPSAEGDAVAATTEPATAPADQAASAGADVEVPDTSTFDAASVPPDLAPPAASKEAVAEVAEASAPEPTTAPSEAETATAAASASGTPSTSSATVTAPAPAAEAGDVASQATADATETSPQSDGAPTETQTAQADTPDPTLTDQAGEASKSLSDMFTDWLTATGDQADEAARKFSLTGASYKPIAQGKGVVTLSGHGPAKAEVRLFVDKIAVGVTTVADSGRWLAEADHWVEPGAHSARAEVLGTDGSVLAGHDMAFTAEGLPEAVATAQPATPGAAAAEGAAAPPPIMLAIADVAYETMAPKQGRITVAGRAEPKSRVAVYADGKSIGTSEAGDSGDWSVASETWLDAGAHAIRAERLSTSGEAVESALSEFVRPPAEVAVAAAETPAADEALPAAAKPGSAKPKKRLLKRSRKDARAEAKRHKHARQAKRARAQQVRLAKARRPRQKTVTLHRGNAAVKIRVPAGRRKAQVLGWLHLGGTGWYRVRRGDTLWRIAHRCYGDGRRYPRIVAYNARAIRNPDLIFPKQRLYVP